MSKLDKLWEDGIDHEESTHKLMKLLKELDRKEGYPADNMLDCGGDGDPGETLMYLFDILLREGKIKIVFDK